MDTDIAMDTDADMYCTELWLAPLQLARATSVAIFLVAPLLFKIDSAATSAASFILFHR